MRRWPCVLFVIATSLAPTIARAQDVPAAVAPPATEATEVSEAAATEPAATSARTPKIAIVIAGDPDPSSIAAATSLERVLSSDAALAMPSDLAVRAALRGEGATGDGLDDVRAERRHLGLGEARDVTSLTVLGELTHADLVLVVRASHGAARATAFDVLRRSFYDGELALEPIDEADAIHFVDRRASRAAQPLAPGETTAPRPAPVVDPATAVPPEAIAPNPEAPAHQPDFFEQYWPYFAAGALLIGAVVFIVFATQNNGTPPPVLRFEVGGGS